jgi:hypothetical protein
MLSFDESIGTNVRKKILDVCIVYSILTVKPILHDDLIKILKEFRPGYIGYTSYILSEIRKY